MNEINYNEPFSDYLKRPAVSKSLLDVFAKCPADAKRIMDGGNGKEQTKAMLTGKLVEEMVQSVSVFAPKMLEAIIEVHPATYNNPKGEATKWNWNANACRDWKKQVPDGKTIMSAEEKENIIRLGELVRNNPIVREIMATGRPQVTLTAKHATGLQIKGRPDWWGEEYITDLKTTYDASEQAFSKAIADRRYHLQAAMYMLLSELNGFHPHTFIFIIAQTGPDPKLNIRYLKSSAVEVGRFRLETELDQFNQCVKSGFWPDYMGTAKDFSTIEPIDIPQYEYNTFPVTLTGAIEV